jgi:hypothetical protein
MPLKFVFVQNFVVGWKNYGADHFGHCVHLHPTHKELFNAGRVCRASIVLENDGGTRVT